MPVDTYLRLGVARNNARALRSKYNFPTLISFRSIPMGTSYQEQIRLPKSALRYKLQYFLFSYPVTAGVFRPIFFEVIDPGGRPYVLFDMKKPETSFGAKGTLFSTPGVDTTPAAAGDTSSYQGMLPINEEFPGMSVLTINIRGALATPNPAFIDILLVGRTLAKGAGA